MKKITRTLLPLSFVLLIALAGCKTPPPLEGEVEPFGIIGKDADAYIYMPLKGNEEFIKKALPGQNEDDMKEAFKRTDKIFSGVFFDGVNIEIRICAKGNYPYKYSGYIFKKKNGWSPKKSKEGYKYYESKYADVSIPSNLIACMVLGSEKRQNMELTLAKLQKPSFPKFPKKFNDLQLSDSSDIAIFIKNPNFFLAQILGVHLGLPLGNIEMYMKKKPSEEKKADLSYSYDLKIEVDNPRTATILKLFLGRTLGAEIKIEDSALKIENRIIPESKIINIMKSLFPY